MPAYILQPLLSETEGKYGMTRIVKQFHVNVSPEKVYALTSHPERWPQWAKWIKHASSDGPRAHWVYDMGGMNVESDTVETKVEENRVYAFQQTGGFLKQGETLVQIEPSKDGSNVTWSLEYEPPYSYLGKMMDKLRIRKQIEDALDDSVKNLKTLLER